jgi:hypothetical protein
MDSGSGAADGLNGVWTRFRAERADELHAWLRAEADFTGGMADVAAGDRLLAAEAALQRAIVDFAAVHHDGMADPTPLALALLKRAEAMLGEPDRG